jgi:hypothetical protein
MQPNGGVGVEDFRVRKDWHYHHGSKITMLFAVEPGDPALPSEVGGSVKHSQCWIRSVHGVGTSINIFQDFCDRICLEIEQFGVKGIDDLHIFCGTTWLPTTLCTSIRW